MKTDELIVIQLELSRKRMGRKHFCSSWKENSRAESISAADEMETARDESMSARVEMKEAEPKVAQQEMKWKQPGWK